MTMRRFRDWIYVSLRLPKPLHAALSQMAKQDGQRSLHSLIVSILDQVATTHTEVEKKGKSDA
jgi:hypothetical protein